MNTPKFSFGFGAQPNTTATGGTATGTSLFGTQPSTSTTGQQQSTNLFGGFGQSSNTTATNTSGFGTQPTSTGTQQQNTFGSGFLSNKTTTGSLFGQPATTNTTTTSQPFGSTGFSTTANPFTFGQTQSTTTAPATTTATTSGFGGFGGFGTNTASNTSAQQPSLFGTTQLGGTTSQTGGSFFGLGQTSQPQQQQQQQLQLQQQQQQQQQQQSSGLFAPQQTLGSSFLGQSATQPSTNPQDIDHLTNALVHAQVYNDERDLILAKWNQLQAFHGFGKIFYQNSAIDVSKEIRLSRFKTIGYSCRPLHKNEDGFVCLVLNQKEANVKSNKKAIVDCLHKIFNSDQSLTINIDSIKPLVDDKCEVVFYVEQRVSPLTDQKNRVPCLLVFNHLNKQETPAPFLGGLKTNSTIKQQLESINVVNVFPLIGLTDEQIKTYLDSTPAGLNPLLWDQAKKNNPNPKKLLPVQIVGFQEINKRFKLQDQENQTQRISLNLINNKIENLNSRNRLIKAKIEQFKARNEELEQRLLKVMINYEIRRKIGIPLQENEKYLFNVLDSFQIELNSPLNKEIMRQKFNEFIEIIKTYETSSRGQQHQQQQQQQIIDSSLSSSSLANSLSTPITDISNMNDVHKTLREQQKAFKSLIEIINQDFKDLNLIKRGLFYEK